MKDSWKWTMGWGLTTEVGGWAGWKEAKRERIGTTVKHEKNQK